MIQSNKGSNWVKGCVLWFSLLLFDLMKDKHSHMDDLQLKPSNSFHLQRAAAFLRIETCFKEGRKGCSTFVDELGSAQSVVKLGQKVIQPPVNPQRTWEDEPQTGTSPHQTCSREGSGLFDGDHRRFGGSQTRRFLQELAPGKSYWDVPPVVLLKSSPLFLMTSGEMKSTCYLYVAEPPSWCSGHMAAEWGSALPFLTAHQLEILNLKKNILLDCLLFFIHQLQILHLLLSSH